jgi:hypothetical protein
MLHGSLNGPDPIVTAQRILCILIIGITVGIAEVPLLKGKYCLRYGLLANMRVGYGVLAPL